MYSVRSAMGVWVAKNACVATLMPEPNPVTIRPAMSQSMPTVGLVLNIIIWLQTATNLNLSSDEMR